MRSVLSVLNHLLTVTLPLYYFYLYFKSLYFVLKCDNKVILFAGLFVIDNNGSLHLLTLWERTWPWNSLKHNRQHTGYTSGYTIPAVPFSYFMNFCGPVSHCINSVCLWLQRSISCRRPLVTWPGTAEQTPCVAVRTLCRTPPPTRHLKLCLNKMWQNT